MISKLKNWSLTIEQVKKFFSKGSSQSPEQNFADMGIDITQKNFWEEWLMNFQVYLDETKALARKLGKF